MHDLFLNALDRYVVREKEAIAIKRKEQEERERKMATIPTHVPEWLNETTKGKYRGLEINVAPLRFFGDKNVPICVMFWLNRPKGTYEVTMDVLDVNVTFETFNETPDIDSKRYTINFPLGMTTTVNQEIFEVKFGSSQIFFLKSNREYLNIPKFNWTLRVLKALLTLNEKNININELGFESDVVIINFLFGELQKIMDEMPVVDYVQAYLNALEFIE